MRRQAQLAIDKADVIILVTDLRSGVTATDQEVASMLLKSQKPLVLCVNKCDRVGDPPPEFYEFYNLGLGDPIAVSSVHGHGTGDLLDAVCAKIDFSRLSREEGDRISGLATIASRMSGKSSLVNRIAGEERTIVSEIAGTTRDATDTEIDNAHGRYLFIDTAGIRRRSRVTDSIEHFSVLRAYMAVDRAQVCVIIIDATEGFTEQDSKIAGYAHEQGKGCIVAVNKWDAVEDKNDRTMQEFQKKLEQDFSFMSYVPFVFFSAKTGQRVDNLFPLINQVAANNAMRITTGALNDLLAHATARVQPPSDKGKRLKIYYITQPSACRPPLSVLSTARSCSISPISDTLRTRFGNPLACPAHRCGLSPGNAEKAIRMQVRLRHCPRITARERGKSARARPASPLPADYRAGIWGKHKAKRRPFSIPPQKDDYKKR